MRQLNARLQKWQNLTLFVVVCAGILGIIMYVHAPKTEALNQNFFDFLDHGDGTCDIAPCNQGAKIRMVLANWAEKNDDFLSVNAVAYFTSSSGTLLIRGINQCGFGTLADDNIKFTITTTASFVPAAPGGATSGCSNANITLNLSGMPYDPQTGLYSAHIAATPHKARMDDRFENFWLQETTNSYVIAQKGGSSGQEVTAVQTDPGSSGPDSLDWSVPFGPDCSVTTPITAKVYYYDLDNTGDSTPQTGGKITMQVRDNTDGTSISWSPGNGNNQSLSHDITVKPGHKYVWILKNVHNKNYIQFSTPFDGIFGIRSCLKPTVLACSGLSTFPAVLEQNVSGDLTMGITWTEGPPIPSTAMTYKVTRPDGSVVGPFATALTVGGASASGVASYNPPAAGTYTASWTFTHNTGAKSITCNAQFTVGTKPYFKVYSGDVQAGAAFTTGVSCGAATGTGNLKAFNRGGATYAGSGTQAAVFALGTIEQFISGSLRPGLPDSLTFSNSLSPPQEYGGGFSTAPCIPDYWKPVSSGQTTALLGVTVLPGDANFSGKKDYFVDSDVWIRGSVKYSTAPWATINDIPSFRVIVRGNIYIDSTVDQLDGIYVAIPNGPGTGNIYTCTIAAAPPNMVEVNNKCQDTQLRVNGAFIAKQVKLLRIKNSLVNAVPNEPWATSSAAEIFNYTPETWLATPEFPTLKTQDYDHITSLPAIL